MRKALSIKSIGIRSQLLEAFDGPKKTLDGYGIAGLNWFHFSSLQNTNCTSRKWRMILTSKKTTLRYIVSCFESNVAINTRTLVILHVSDMACPPVIYFQCNRKHTFHHMVEAGWKILSFEPEADYPLHMRSLMSSSCEQIHNTQSTPVA